MTKLSDEKINEIVREASRGAATRRDGTTSQRIARAIEAAVLEAQGKQGPFDADDPRFREAFEASLKSGNWPMTRLGDGYRSSITMMAFTVAFETVNRLRLFAAPVVQPDMVMVPREPTEAMLNSCWRDYPEAARETWRAMIAAAEGKSNAAGKPTPD